MGAASGEPTEEDMQAGVKKCSAVTEAPQPAAAQCATDAPFPVPALSLYTGPRSERLPPAFSVLNDASLGALHA